MPSKLFVPLNRSVRRRLGRVACVSSAAALLCSCTSMAPPLERAALPVPQQYTQSDGADAVPWSGLSWDQYFNDPVLRQLIAQALLNNRDVRVAQARVREAQAQYGVQKADQWPSLTGQASMTRARTPADLNITGMPLVGSQYQVGVGMASWELDFWGRVSSLRDAALDSYLATDAALQAVSLSMITQVAQAYLNLLELDERIELARQTLRSREESLRIFARREAVGSASRFNLIQVQTLLSQAQALVAQLAQSREAQAHVLDVLVGGQAVLPARSGSLDAQIMPGELAAGLPSSLLTSRPDIIAAEYQLKAAHAQIGVARAAFFPRIALTSNYGTASSELDGLFKAGSQSWSFLPSLSMPLFDHGRNQNNLSLAQARRDIAVAQYEKTIQVAFKDVADSLSARVWLQQQLEIADATMASQLERARLAQLRFDSGATGYLDVLDAQRDLLIAQQQWVQSKRAVQANRVNLFAALGGGGMRMATRAAAQ